MSKLEDICDDFIYNGFEGFGRLVKAMEKGLTCATAFFGECLVWLIAVVVMTLIFPFALFNYWRKDA